MLKIDLSPLQRFERQLGAQIDRSAPGPINDFFMQAGARILGMERRRFAVLSRGGSFNGERWKPLKPSTIAGRRFGKGRAGQTIGGARQKAIQRARKARTQKQATQIVRTLKRTAAAAGSVAILRDTGTLFAALDKGAPGNVLTRIPGGVAIGFGGAASHPAGPTIGEIAGYHHRGAGKNPRRRVVTNELDAQTAKGVQADLRRAIVKLGRQTGGPA